MCHCLKVTNIRSVIRFKICNAWCCPLSKKHTLFRQFKQLYLMLEREKKDVKNLALLKKYLIKIINYQNPAFLSFIFIAHKILCVYTQFKQT